jgi:hypothetical protein
VVARRKSLPRLSEACLNQHKPPKSLGFPTGAGFGDSPHSEAAGEGLSEQRQAMKQEGKALDRPAAAAPARALPLDAATKLPV